MALHTLQIITIAMCYLIAEGVVYVGVRPLNASNVILSSYDNKNHYIDYEIILQRKDQTLKCKKITKNTELSAGETVTFISPSYPKKYSKKSKCGWLLKTKDESATFEITCSKFNLEKKKGKKCKDYLELDKKKFCGSSGPTKWTSDSNEVNIKFVSDKKKNYKGFTCTASVAAASTTSTTTSASTSTTSTTTTSSSTTTTTTTTTTRTSTSTTTSSNTSTTTTTTTTSCICESTTTSTFATSTSTTCGVVNRESRIMYGQAAEAQEYPWMAALVGTGQNRSFCGGSLINDRWVLTAAHCLAGLYGVSGAAQMQVLLYEHSFVEDDGEERYNVSQVIMNPDYDVYPWYNGSDFGLLELATPVDFSNTLARPICIPKNDSNPYNNVLATVTGWGYKETGQPYTVTNTDVLMEVDISTLSNQQCQSTWYGSSGVTVMQSMICAGTTQGKGACMGDSGGPMITRAPYTKQPYYEQIGVVSFGSAYCDYYGVFARVTAVLDWIRRIAENGTEILCEPPSQT